MTDKDKIEEVSDGELDQAQGGFASWVTGTLSAKAEPGKGDGFGSWGTGTMSLKQPTTRMEEENPDE
ncbi:MAG: hypothetical protein AAFR17_02005 [Pseudomonadota bacterium]